jgi:lipopolysaccharide exporter
MPSTAAAPSASTTSAPSLSKRTVDAFAWRLLSESSKLALQIGVQVTLARLLPVDAFGVLAIASVVVELGSRISEIGTGPAVIQRAEITPRHIRAAFMLSVTCGSLVSLAIWLGAPLARTVFRVESATPVLRLIGLVFAIGGIGTVAESLLLRRMDYRRLLVVDLVSYVCGYAGVGICLALRHYGVWALAWATLAQTAIKTALLLILSPHPMRPCLARTETKQLLNFGVGMTLDRLASFAAQKADYFVVARWLGPTALGFYSRAFQLMCLPIYQLSSILNSVLFPAYSSIQRDPARLRRGYLASVCLSSMGVFPVLTILAIVAPDLMTAVFGPHWAPAGPALRTLCLAGVLFCVYVLSDSLVRASGAVYQKFVYNTVYLAAVLAGAFAGTRWGIGGVAAGVVSATAVAYVLMSRLSLRLTQTGWQPFFAAQRPAVALSCAVAAAAIPAAGLLRASGSAPLLVLIGTSAAGVVALLAAALAVPGEWIASSVREPLCNARQMVWTRVLGRTGGLAHRSAGPEGGLAHRSAEPESGLAHRSA